MKTYESLALWTNDPLIGIAAEKILDIAKKHGCPSAPWKATPHEFDIPFDYHYDVENEANQALLRRVGVLFAAIDVHCYFRDRKQVVGVLHEPGAPESQAWSKFVEEALDVILMHCEKLNLAAK